MPSEPLMPFFFRHERVHDVFHRYTHDLVQGIWMFVIYFLIHGLWIDFFIDKVRLSLQAVSGAPQKGLVEVAPDRKSVV